MPCPCFSCGGVSVSAENCSSLSNIHPLPPLQLILTSTEKVKDVAIYVRSRKDLRSLKCKNAVSKMLFSFQTIYWLILYNIYLFFKSCLGFSHDFSINFMVCINSSPQLKKWKHQEEQETSKRYKEPKKKKKTKMLNCS